MEEASQSLLQRLVTTPGPSGFEQPVQQLIHTELQGITDQVRIDIHGNVIGALRPEQELRVMLTAHSDEIGFLVRYIDEQGFLYFAPIGGFDPSTLPGGRVEIHTPNGAIPGIIGRKPVHTLSGSDREKAPKLSELWIDIGAANKEEAQKLIPIGSPVTRTAQAEIMRNDIMVSKALDDRAGIFVVLEAMRLLHEQRDQLQVGVYAVATVQEEIGSRGAQTAAHSVHPAIAIAVDVTFTSDHPGTSKQELGDIRLHGGPVITIGSFVNPRVYQLLTQTAANAEIAWQIDPQAAHTYTDTDLIQVARDGVATGLVSIPCRYLHTGSEMVALQDLEAAARLLARFVLALEKETNLIP